MTSTVVMARNAQAPTGRGSSTRPRMVVTKMDSRFQPCACVCACVCEREGEGERLCV